jgi:hypothetical protein
MPNSADDHQTELPQVHRKELTCTIGNRQRFAVEFEIPNEVPKVWNETWGSLWLWVEGHLVGRHESEMISIGLDSLQETANENLEPASRILATYDAKRALQAVMWSRYGGTETPATIGVIANEQLSAAEVLPRTTGPFFDGWQAVLLDEGVEERFIYRQGEGQIYESKWPSGTLKAVIDLAKREFERLARATLNGTNSIS